MTKMTAEAQNSTSDLLTKAFIDMGEFEAIQATLRDSNEEDLMDDEEVVENNAEMSGATKQLCGSPAKRRRKKKKEKSSNMMLDMMKKLMVSQNNLVAGVTAFKAENEQAMVKVDKVTKGLEAVERETARLGQNLTDKCAEHAEVVKEAGFCAG